MPEGLPLLMDRAYEGDETRQLVLSLGMIPVVPPKFFEAGEDSAEAFESPEVQPHRALGIRPRSLQEAQRNRAALSSSSASSTSPSSSKRFASVNTL
jgi:hypothetical protein